MKIAITGAGRGLGKGLVEAYLKSSSENVVHAFTSQADGLKSLADQYSKQLFVHGRIDSKTKLPEGLTSLDLLINNAGFYPKEGTGFSKVSSESILAGVEGNVLPALIATQLFLPALRKGGRNQPPRIIFMSSLMGSIKDNQAGGSFGYRMAKASLNMMMKGLSLEEKKIVCASLHPGWVKTDMGGAEAPLAVEDSVAGMVRVIQGLRPQDTGGFFDYSGKMLSW